jgi:hypothetical protein
LVLQDAIFDQHGLLEDAIFDQHGLLQDAIFDQHGLLQDAIFDQHGLLQANKCSLELIFFFLFACFYQQKKIEQVCFGNLTMCFLPSYHFLCWFFKTDNVLIFLFSSFLLRQSTIFVLEKMAM